jgi:Ca-activated chloride channel family protein
MSMPYVRERIAPTEDFKQASMVIQGKITMTRSSTLAILMIQMLILFASAASAQNTGPLNESPRRRPRPEATTETTRTPQGLPKVKTRTRQIRPDEADPLFTSDTSIVTVDVSVVDKNGNFIPGIPKGNFQVIEDGTPQKILNFGHSQAAMTVALVIEFSNLFQRYWTESWYQTLQATYGFVETLKPDDWAAVVAYDLRPEILSDFTQDRSQTRGALRRLRIAAYSESNLYDALVYTVERMKDIEGRKSVVLITSGIDTFSKLNFGETRRKVQDGGVTVYAIGLMQALRIAYDAYGRMGPLRRMDFLQADSQLRTFARETGGIAFFPRFYGEFPTIYRAIQHSMRNQYSMTYSPTNTKQDGNWRKIKVRLVDPKNNKNLRIVNQKGKSIKYQIMAKAGYTAPREVE